VIVKKGRHAAALGEKVLKPLGRGRIGQRGRPAASRGRSPEFNHVHRLGVADVLGARAADVPGSPSVS